MEIARCGADRVMPEQPLQGVEIDAGLEQMSCKAVTQHMDAAGLVYAGAALGLLEGFLDTRSAHGASPISPRKEVLARLRPSPVVAQGFEELRGEQG